MFISKEEKLQLQTRATATRLQLDGLSNKLEILARTVTALQRELQTVKALGTEQSLQLAVALDELRVRVEHRYGTKKDGTPKARPGGPRKEEPAPMAREEFRRQTDAPAPTSFPVGTQVFVDQTHAPMHTTSCDTASSDSASCPSDSSSTTSGE
jgi:hypothetical protein